jgi:phosphatidate cytidylyltransferase
VTEKNRNLLVRLVTALVALPIVLFLLYKGGWWTAGLLAFGAGAVAGEYIVITLKSLSPIGWLAVACAAMGPVFVVWQPYAAPALVCAAMGLLMLAAWAWHLLQGPLHEAPTRAAHLMMGAIYGGGGMTALMAVRNLPDGGWWLVAALTITWMNDTTAYFAGRFLGRHKLYPEVSPNKTWEGFAGGMVGSIAGLFILKFGFFPAVTVADCIVMGVLGGVLGPAGDLCESMLKRAYGVKDSGKIIPGHGGMLDRVDALIFNAPMVLVYLQFARGVTSG